MDTNEIMANDEVVEVAVEITERTSRKGLKVAVGIGLTMLVCGIAYRYVVKPMRAKVEAERARLVVKGETVNRNDDDTDESNETD